VLNRPLAYAPLVPFAIAVTAAIVTDRYLPISSSVWLVSAGIGGLTWLAAFRRNDLLALAGLWVFAGSLGGAYHHAWRNDFAADDIGNIAGVEPKLIRVRAALDDDPFVRRHAKDDSLVSRPRSDVTVVNLVVSAVESDGVWQSASGNARLTVEGLMPDLHVGDEVEVTGWLSQPLGPMNPGEWDYSSHLRDDRIRAELRVHHTSDGVVRLSRGPWGWRRLLSTFRGWGQRAISETLEPSESSIGSALLLGDNAAMSADEWDRYVRTGVIHVLAISGQHLVILGAFLWFVLRLLGVRRRTAAVVVATTLLTYAMMTGGRPSAVRAAVIACSVCGGILIRATPLPANTFALAWLVVLAINPTDLFTAGFQLSFLCVAVLIWGVARWFAPREPTPMEQLVNESRSSIERGIRGTLRLVGQAYLVTLVLGLATAPLVAYWQNIMSPAGLVIGPIAILLTTIALIAGFLLLMLWPLGPVAAPLAWVAGKSIALCDYCVDLAGRLPSGYWYVGSLPTWWVVGFYAILSVWLFVGTPEIARLIATVRTRLWFPVGLIAWTLLGLAAGIVRPDSDEMRVTFVAVDHGGCAVIETTDGRVLLYDAGATAGPDVTKRHIAPFLWSRGIRRVDEVFLSHADLDHFNGLNALLDRFAVGQVTMTPTFAEKPTAGVHATLAALERRAIPVRIARAGDQFRAGDVTLDVLHPPPNGPDGVENVRSLVLLVTHRGHTILLTGDLEGVGIDRVKSRPAPKIDVLMTPHHGSGVPAEAIADWARPRLVVASQGRTDLGKAGDVFAKRGVPYWPTWPNGAITIRSHSTGLVAETFATGKRDVVRSGAGQ
jgi:competence protein ComEC